MTNKEKEEFSQVVYETYESIKKALPERFPTGECFSDIKVVELASVPQKKLSEDVRQHLLECAYCRRSLELAKKPLDEESIESAPSPFIELESVKKKKARFTSIAIAASVLLVFGVSQPLFFPTKIPSASLMVDRVKVNADILSTDHFYYSPPKYEFRPGFFSQMPQRMVVFNLAASLAHLQISVRLNNHKVASHYISALNEALATIEADREIQDYYRHLEVTIAKADDLSHLVVEQDDLDEYLSRKGHMFDSQIIQWLCVARFAAVSGDNSFFQTSVGKKFFVFERSYLDYIIENVEDNNYPIGVQKALIELKEIASQENKSSQNAELTEKLNYILAGLKINV